MHTLQVEYPVLDFDTWKAAFDSDPGNRAEAGVRRYHVYRLVDDPEYVVVTLDFDTADEARAFHGTLCRIFRSVEGKMIRNPRTRLACLVEHGEY
jgi:hypothetical protein